jgi:hypothetical protein
MFIISAEGKLVYQVASTIGQRPILPMSAPNFVKLALADIRQVGRSRSPVPPYGCSVTTPNRGGEHLNQGELAPWLLRPVLR